ncbi:serine/threonine-protein kinase MARK2-like [Schistocerca gregaria]|uniref:serine/threonine-protein kinase MARK2-like n=1 Tax=Schistocerca gregaria TaxID=7010 RepID=UPI00211DC033|nr:serine/threonine-protein kinase MARK2-like [Schistocerca gregaria]
MSQTAGRISHREAFKQIRHYSIIKTLGKGQFGYVKLAVHLLTGIKVAIKFIVKRRLDDESLLKVKREVEIMKLLNHPNVIRLYEVIETDTCFFLIMEYATGGEVMDFLVTHGRLKEKDARRLFRQVVSAVDYCHRLHVIHRDLKAENLLLDKDLRVKLIDFGLSNFFVPGELRNTFCGSLTYTAPELIKRQMYEGRKVDVWSLGILLYVLVCGALPFNGDNFRELLTKIVVGKYQVPSYVSAECRDLLGIMLVVDPEERATLDEVRVDPWLRSEEGRAVPKSVVVDNKAKLPKQINKIVLQELVRMQLDREQLVSAIIEDPYGRLAASYYLLLDEYKSRKRERRVPIQNVDRRRGLKTVGARDFSSRLNGLEESGLGEEGNRHLRNDVIDGHYKKRLNDNGFQESRQLHEELKKKDVFRVKGGPLPDGRGGASKAEEGSTPALSGQERTQKAAMCRLARSRSVVNRMVSEQKAELQGADSKEPQREEANLDARRSTRQAAGLEDAIILPLEIADKKIFKEAENKQNRKSNVPSQDISQLPSDGRKQKPLDEGPSRVARGLGEGEANRQPLKAKNHQRNQKYNTICSHYRSSFEDLNIIDIPASGDAGLVETNILESKLGPSERGGSPLHEDLENKLVVLMSQEEGSPALDHTPHHSVSKKNQRKPCKRLQQRIFRKVKNLFKLPSSKPKSLKYEAKPPVGRFPINSQNVRADQPEQVLHYIQQALSNFCFQKVYKIRPFCMRVETKAGVAFEVEVCQLPNLYISGIRFRRIYGDVWQYADVCHQILHVLNQEQGADREKRSKF